MRFALLMERPWLAGVSLLTRESTGAAALTADRLPAVQARTNERQESSWRSPCSQVGFVLAISCAWPFLRYIPQHVSLLVSFFPFVHFTLPLADLAKKISKDAQVFLFARFGKS